MAPEGRKGRLSALQECDATGAAGFEGRRPESLPRQGNFIQSRISRIILGILLLMVAKTPSGTFV